MKLKIAQIKPGLSENVHPKRKILLPKQQDLCTQQQPSLIVAGEPRLASNGSVFLQTADRTERTASKGSTKFSAKCLQKETRRPSVAFGCCLPPESSTAKSRAASSTLQGSSAIPVLSNPSLHHDDSVSREHLGHVCNGSTAFRSDPVVVDPSSTVGTPCSTTCKAAAHQPVRVVQVQSNQERQWPRLELALHQYRQRASTCRQMGHVHSLEEPDAKGEATDKRISHSSLDSLPNSTVCSSNHVFEGCTSGGRTQSLELLGFSSSRIRRVESAYCTYFSSHAVLQ
jgi:hypothetical protein